MGRPRIGVSRLKSTNLHRTAPRVSKWRLGILPGLLFWQLVVFALGGWWVSLLFKQGLEIEKLETSLGVSQRDRDSRMMRMRRMLWSEGMSFFILLIGSTGLLSWLYIREIRRSRSVRVFFAALAHELRNPLTSIRLQTELVAEDADSKKKVVYAHLLEDISRLESQLEKSLELARIEGGGPVVALPISLDRLLGHADMLWEGELPDRFRILLEDGEQRVFVDPDLFVFILRNLRENAIRHSQSDAPAMILETTSSASFVKISFYDSGAGYSGDTAELGQLFQKGTKSPGAGVGLYLVKTLMQRMGGRAAFKNGRGFEVELFFRRAP